MAVPAVNLTIEKGADFVITFKVKSDGASINLTGYTFSCKMRKHPTALSPASSGVVKLEMSKVTTSAIPVGRYIWDLLITSGGTTTKAIKGTVIVEGTAS
jgi:hypothetical protein